MSAETPLSGIVFYPANADELAVASHFEHPELESEPESAERQRAEALLHPPVPANIARQLGMVTNSYVTGTQIFSGTALAVPYAPALAHEIQDLRYEGGQLVQRLGESERIQERRLLEEIVASSWDTLHGFDLVKGPLSVQGLFHALVDRRIDVILPPLKRARTHGLTLALQRLITTDKAAEFAPAVAAHAWTQRTGGIFVERTHFPHADQHHAIPTTEHPLWMGLLTSPLSSTNQLPSEHTIETTAASGTGFVQEHVILPTEEQQIVVGIDQHVGVIDKHVVHKKRLAHYHIPHDQPEITTALAEQGSDMSDAGTAQRRRYIAAMIDPASSGEWVMRIR